MEGDPPLFMRKVALCALYHCGAFEDGAATLNELLTAAGVNLRLVHHESSMLVHVQVCMAMPDVRHR